VPGEATDGVFGWLRWSVGVFAVGEVVLGGEVEVGFVAGAGGDGVAGLLVEVVGGQGEGAVNGGALESVGG